MSATERYFFLRFQKVGSSALVQRIRQHLGDGVFPVFRQPRNADAIPMSFCVDPLVSHFRNQPDSTRVLVGHYPLCVTEVLGVPFKTFTVLRDPVERALSLLRARSQGEERYRGKTLEDLYDDPALHNVIHNHMVKMLTLRPDEMGNMPLTVRVDFTDERFARAVTNLEGLDVIGLQERMDDLCAALDHRFGWHLERPAVVNPTEARPVSEALRRRIADDNAMDIELYQRGRELVALSTARS